MRNRTHNNTIMSLNILSKSIFSKTIIFFLSFLFKSIFPVLLQYFFFLIPHSLSDINFFHLWWLIVINKYHNRLKIIRNLCIIFPCIIDDFLLSLSKSNLSIFIYLPNILWKSHINLIIFTSILFYHCNDLLDHLLLC